MKKSVKIKIGVSVAMAAMFAACAVHILDFDVNQPQPDGTMAPRAKVNQEVTFTINGHVECYADRTDQQLVFGMLAPKSWKIANNMKVTLRVTQVGDPDVDYPMTVIPATEQPRNMQGYTWPEAIMERHGLGANVLNDMEWVVWKSVDGFDVLNNGKPTFTVTVKGPTGPKNVRFKIGFFINDIDDGMTGDDQYWSQVNSDIFEVYGGMNPTIDYCNPHFNSVEPLNHLQDDYVTYTFVSNAYANDLVSDTNKQDVYLKATAITDAGRTITKKEKMNEPEPNRYNYTLTIWPAKWFDVNEGETITRVEYVYVNADESVVIDKALDDKMVGDPFVVGTPFSVDLFCD